MGKEEIFRQKAINMYSNGIRITDICREINRSRKWFYKWFKRSLKERDGWYKSKSHIANRIPNKTNREIENKIIEIRKNLVDVRMAQIGANSIGWEFKKQGLEPPPIWTISRVIRRNNLVKVTNKKYIPKGKNYPEFIGKEPYGCYQFDVVGPRYLKGGVRFYAANLIDVGSHLVSINIIHNRRNITLANALITSFVENGLPKYLQMDNSLPLRGSNRYPHSFGIIIRVCLHLEIQPVFIPISEPWRNGIIEHFQNTFDKKFFRIQRFHSFDALSFKTTEFQGFHNSYYRYSANGGRTPSAVLSETKHCKKSLSEAFEIPNKLHIEKGFIHLIRFIRSDCMLDIFGQKFPVPEDVQYEYIRATIDTYRQQLSVFLDDKVICIHKYPIPSSSIKINQKV